MGMMGNHVTGKAEHLVLHRDPFSYSAHPHLIAAAPDNWLLVFTQAPRREGLRIHPPQDPMYRNMLMRSSDEGRSWSTPVPVPGYGWTGLEVAGLTALSDGTILLNQWQFEWHTLAHAERGLPPDAYVRPERLLGSEAMAAELADWTPDQSAIARRFPWARGGGATWVHRSDDGGATFGESMRIDTAPYSGGYGMRGAVAVDGHIVLPLTDVPNYRALFVVRSADGGRTWSQPIPVAEGAGHEFEEPAPLLLPSGRILMLLRDNGSRILHAVWSDDAGLSWSAPVPTGIADYPADLILLPDGRIGCVTGRRRAPFAITFYLSADGGLNWSHGEPATVRGDLPNADLGYPSVVARRDGNLFVAYYAQDRDGVTGIDATVIRPAASHGEVSLGRH